MLADALDQAVARLEDDRGRLSAHRAEGFLPHLTDGGRWRLAPILQTGRWEPGGWHHASWTGGFVAGQLWQASRRRRSNRLEAEARAITEALAPRADDRTTHDLGFLFYPSAVLGHLATGEARFRELALKAARTLAGRLLPAGVLQSWGALDDSRARGSSIVDTLPNLALLWWAEREGLDEAGRTARSHARLSAEAYVREDGSTCHSVRFGEDGAVLERGTIQGYAPESTWSRGQAWAVHGFAEAFRATAESWALEAAEQTAAFFFDRLPDDLVPPWDFDAPPGGPRDASAGAIASAAALTLAAARPGRGHAWRERGLALLAALVQRCLNRGAGDGLLLDCCVHYPRREGIGCATAWGDYFLIDALLQAEASKLRLDPLR